MKDLTLECSDLSPTGRPFRIKNPSWDEVESAIRKMDGRRFTEACLTDSEDCGLYLTGGCLNETGNDRRFMCEKLCGDAHPLALVRLSLKTSDKTVNILENEPPEFPEYLTSGLGTILNVMKTYLETGELDSKYEWEE